MRPRVRDAAGFIGRVLGVVVLALSVGCGGSGARSSSVAATTGSEVEFAFGVLDGTVITSENTHGRTTALLFVTSYDLVSQVAVRRLEDAFRRRKPRFNAAVIVLEHVENALLVQTFKDSLRLSCPVGIADLTELHQNAALRSIDRVPTLLVLDRAGRERARHSGGFEPEQLASFLDSAEK